MARPILSMTTVPPRFAHLGAALDSLLSQSLRPARILLFVPERYRRFADTEPALPKLPRGVHVVRCPRDYGPATKVLAPVRAIRDPDQPLIFVDDDVCYPPDFVERLVDASKERPDMAITLAGENVPGRAHDTTNLPRARPRPEQTDWGYRARHCLYRATKAPHWAPLRRPFRRDGHVDLFQHGAGGLVRPRFFDGRAFAIPNLWWGFDTIWLSGNLAARGVPIWLSANAPAVTPTEAAQQAPLWEESAEAVHEASQKQAFAYMQRTFGAWL